jgi:bud site selection protein 31
MSRVRRNPSLNPPAEWAEVRDLIVDFTAKLKEAEDVVVDDNWTREQWVAINRANWIRCRCVYIRRYISRTMKEDLFEWILKEGFAERDLIALWRKTGYERVCCVRCASDKSDAEGCACRRTRTANELRDAPAPKCRECWCPGCRSRDSDGKQVPYYISPWGDNVQELEAEMMRSGCRGPRDE